MKRFSAFMLTGISLTLAFTIVAGCEKKQEEKPPMAPMTQSQAEAPATHGTEQKVEKTVAIPENIKAAWKKAMITVVEKDSKKSTDYTVGVNSEFQVPGSNLMIKVGDFIPDFTMDGSNYTSASDKANNPALQVEIFEDGKSVFKGWLFSKFPGMHPFEHPKFGITLKEGVKG